jgi:hypothetical protein
VKQIRKFLYFDWKMPGLQGAFQFFSGFRNQASMAEARVRFIADHANALFFVRSRS